MSEEAEKNLIEMAARIREMREIIGYSVEQMAEKTEVSVEDYKAVEAGKLDPTFNFLHQCAITFGVDINALLKGHSAHLSGYEVTRAGQGPLTAHETHMDIRNQAAMFQNRLGTPYWVTYKYDPALMDKPISTTTHAGQEFDIVLKGSMKIRVGEHIEELHEGDSIYYRSSTPHGMLATDPNGVTFLAMVMAGEGGDTHLGLETVRPRHEKVPLVVDKFVECEENASGHLEHVKFKNTECFNFAFDIIDEIANRYPEKLALLHVSDHFTERRFTFREISDISNQMANYFRSVGIGKGDKVLFILKRHWQYWPAVLALHKVGAIVIPAVSQLKDHDLVYRFKAADVKALVCTADGDVAHEAELAEAEIAKEKPGYSLIKMIVNGAVDGTKTSYGIKTAKNKANTNITKIDTYTAIDENTLDDLYFDYGADSELGGEAVLQLTKADLKAIGQLRGTNEKQRLFTITPQGNGNRGVIADGGVQIPYVLVPQLTAGDLIYGNPMHYLLGLFGDYEIRVDESVKSIERMHTILGDAMIGGNVVEHEGFVYYHV